VSHTAALGKFKPASRVIKEPLSKVAVAFYVNKCTGDTNMPKMFLHTRQGVFTSETRARVAAALTNLGIACEHLADTEPVRAGIWVFFTEHAPDAIFRGGEIASDGIMTLVVYALQGGLDGESKRRLIAEATAILGEHAGSNDDQVPLYVVIHEIPEVSWGMFGKQVSLAALRAAG
jgi:phenylpyruvate tautomerase PptA (4-oxalocrotonate tautomerase family)